MQKALWAAVKRVFVALRPRRGVHSAFQSRDVGTSIFPESQVELLIGNGAGGEKSVEVER